MECPGPGQSTSSQEISPSSEGAKVEADGVHERDPRLRTRTRAIRPPTQCVAVKATRGERDRTLAAMARNPAQQRSQKRVGERRWRQDA
jgi:hypothetical protein